MFIDRLDEEFLLFALDGSGHFVEPRRGAVDTGVAGAWLAEMVLHNRVKLQDDRVVHRGHSDFGEPVLGEMLRSVWGARRPRRVRSWVESFARKAGRRKQLVLHRLAERGYLEKVGEGRSARYIAHGEGRATMRLQLLEVLQGRRAPDEPTVALLALLDAAGLLGHVFAKDGEDPQQLHVQAQLLLRRYRTVGLIADSVRAKRAWAWWPFARSPKQGPLLQVRGRTLRKAAPAGGRQTGFDPKTGGRRSE